MPRLLVSVFVALLLGGCGDGEPLLPPDAVLPDGGRYRGEIVEGRLHGQGRVDYPDGSWYAGQFQGGQLEGPGEWHGANGETYRGGFHLGQFDGIGSLDYGDGDIYSGGFKLGRMHGEGHLQRGTVDYRGGFEKDQYHGLGTLTDSDGTTYQGRFARGLPEGEGVRTDPGGGQYSGTFKQGQLQGEGSYRGADGEQYSGGFRDSLFHGKGRYQNGDGDVWVGRFRHGALDGDGEFHGADGRIYKGAFHDWQFAGQGTLTQADGSQQSGTWSYGRLIRDSQGKALPDPLELGLLEQGRLLDQAIAAVAPSTPEPELYALTLAGDGKQSVFLREADYVTHLLTERFGARGSITLANHRDHLADRPLATRESLTRAVRALAERSGPEDLVFIYLTSHGSAQHELNLDEPRLQLNDLPASELAALLQPLHGRRKVVVISACYSGGFLPLLKDDDTLVMAAARHDRVSFGCSDDNDFTYFGRALFANALQRTDDLKKAFDLASREVARREQEEGFEASEPQLWAPEAVLEQWQRLQAQRPKAAATAGDSATDAASSAGGR
jgi:hypothetical protein